MPQPLIFRKEPSTAGTAPSERTLYQQLQRGILAIDKPPGPSSHEVSAFVRKLTHATRTGHTGTLDQNVSGVLVVLLNESRKLAGFLSKSRKAYVCLMRLDKAVEASELEEAFSHFRGKIYQTPPEASAVKKRLRVRQIFQLKILEAEGRDVLFYCECEAGTYIRNIVHDLGEVLGLKSEMKELRRTLAGGINERHAITLQQLSDFMWLSQQGKPEKLRQAVLPVETVISESLRRIVLKDACLDPVSHGVRPKISDILQLDPEIEAQEIVAGFTGKGSVAFILQTTLSAREMAVFEKEGRDVEVANVARVILDW